MTQGITAEGPPVPTCTSRTAGTDETVWGGLEPRGARTVRAAVTEFALNHVAAWQPLHGKWRTAILRRSGMTVGDRVVVGSHSWWGGSDVSIGDDTFINVGCSFDNSAPITIGARVALAPGVTITTGTHEVGDLGPGRRTGRAGTNRVAPVVIGDDCWIGTRVVILPGVVVAPGCIVGAGALVTRSTEPNGVYTGVPARRTRDLPPPTGSPSAPVEGLPATSRA